jgi:hypothetical protein
MEGFAGDEATPYDPVIFLWVFTKKKVNLRLDFMVSEK